MSEFRDLNGTARDDRENHWSYSATGPGFRRLYLLAENGVKGGNEATPSEVGQAPAVDRTRIPSLRRWVASSGVDHVSGPDHRRGARIQEG